LVRFITSAIVIERETNGTFSAWVAGLPAVYAAADTAALAKRVSDVQ
jgi:hypothetical protein